jgi:hypothetical protein
MCQTTRTVTYPARRLTALRPTSYRSSLDPGPWSIALRHLNANGYSDQDIADTLCNLDSEAILTLDRRGSWKREAVASVSIIGAGGLWTKRTVQYHRERLGIPPAQPYSSQQEERSDSPGKMQAARRRLYQESQGWFSLLPAYDERQGYYEGLHYDKTLGYCRGLELRPTEVRILTLLWRYGPQSRKQLLHRLGCRTLHHTKGSYLSRLHDALLIRREGWTPPLWSLAPGLHPDVREVTVDGHEERVAALLKIRESEEVVRR